MQSDIRRSAFWMVAIIITFFIGRRYVAGVESPIITSTVSAIMYPILYISDCVVTPIKSWYAHREFIRDLSAKYEALQHEYAAMHQELIAAYASADYARDIAELSAFKKRYEDDHALIAHIMMRYISSESHHALLDVGSYHGVQQDMVAIDHNALVGKIIEVHPFSSKLLFITDKRCKIAAYAHDTNTPGIHEGSCYTDQTSLHHVSHLSSLREGDMVLSSGEGIVFPRGFGIGTIVSYSVQGLLYDVRIQPFVDVTTISYCMLIHKGMSTIAKKYAAVTDQ